MDTIYENQVDTLTVLVSVAVPVAVIDNDC